VSPIASLSIVIPAYNETGSLDDVLDEVLAEFDHRAVAFEIIVVDDGSRDDSFELLSSRSLSEPRIKVLRHDRNLGKGSAIRTGLKGATGEWILCVDADLQIPLSFFGAFASHSEIADILIGYRFDKRYTWHRMLISRMYRLMVRMLFGVTVRDIGCPFKLYRGDQLRGVPLATNGFGIDVELLWRLSRRGLKIVELPVDSRPRIHGMSKVTIRGIAGCVRELLQLRMHG
jgi:glycosyltransferase involved in cell wall biosynthesis